MSGPASRRARSPDRLPAMTAGPSPQITEDPRFPEVFGEALKKQNLPPELGEPVRRLVAGEADPRTFLCCDSGCHPCVKDYLRAAEHVLKRLARPVDAAPARPWWAFWRRG